MGSPSVLPSGKVLSAPCLGWAQGSLQSPRSSVPDSLSLLRDLTPLPRGLKSAYSGLY